MIRRDTKAEVYGSELPRSLECYEFYKKLPSGFNDGLCEHCRKYLTVECPNIDKFLEEEGIEEE